MATTTDVEFAEMLREMMRERGLTNQDFARLVGSNPVNISRVLNGKETLSADRLVRYLRALGMRLQPVPMNQGEPPANKKTPISRVKTQS